ncbi:MAG: GAF domain-containing protein, partial [Dehalococcoidia bacterium]
DRDWPESVNRITTFAIASLPLLLLLVVDDFAGVHRFLLVVATTGLILLGVSLFLVAATPGNVYLVLAMAYSVVLFGYSTVRFGLAARASAGMSQRRLQALVIGGSLLALAVASGRLSILIAQQQSEWAGLSRLALFGSAIAYAAGFMPPRSFQTAWQASRLQQFLAESTRAPRGSLGELVTALEDSICPMVPDQSIEIALWDDRAGRLLVRHRADARLHVLDNEPEPVRQAFEAQTASFVHDAERSDPANALRYRTLGVRSIMIAPITVDTRRLGVLVAIGERPRLFAEDELATLELLARQVAILVRDFGLQSELTAFRAHEEATGLKDDFLAAAAHDLKTPLTTLLAQSQLMQRHALRDPDRPTDIEGIERLIRETQRMRRLVNDLLDAARGDQIGFVGERVMTDLHALIVEVIAQVPTGRSICFEGVPVQAPIDPNRMRQVLANLLDNAIKYSPDGGDIDVTLRADAGEAVLSVADHGIGIAADEIPAIFERFRRAAGVRQGSMTGLGLGLYFCKRIVEEHGGRISVESAVGRGSRFEVRLPLVPPADLASGDRPAATPVRDL